jgi:hypothetical protein
MSEQLQFKKSQKEPVFQTGPLTPQAKYFWRVDEVAGTDTVRGPLWHFITK